MTAFIITGGLGILLILVLSLVVYRVFYNYQVNKALNTGIPAKTLSPGAILISLVFVLLIVLNILLFNEIVDTANKINNLEYQNYNLTVLVEEMSDNLSEQILDNNKNTYDDVFTYEGLVDNELGFNLSFKIKSLNSDTTVTVLVEDSEGDMVEYNVTKDVLTYSTDIILDIEEEYKIYVKIEGTDNTFIELIDYINPYDILSARFEVYPIRVKFNSNEFKVTFHNQLDSVNGSLEGLEVDYIQLQYFNHTSGDEEIIIVTNFYRDDEGSNYLGESVYLEALFIGEHSQPKDSNLTVHVTIFDKDGHYYSFTVEPSYTSEIRMTETTE